MQIFLWEYLDPLILAYYGRVHKPKHVDTDLVEAESMESTFPPKKVEEGAIIIDNPNFGNLDEGLPF